MIDQAEELYRQSLESPLDVRVFGIENIFALDPPTRENVSMILHREFRDRVMWVKFIPPPEIFGYVRMMSERELEGIQSGMSVQKAEFFAIAIPQSAEQIGDVIPDIVRAYIHDQSNDDYTQVIFIPREEFDAFGCSLSFHEHFTPDFPAISVSPDPIGPNIRRWNWSSIRFKNITDQC